MQIVDTLNPSTISVIIPNLHSPVIGAVIESLRQQTMPPDAVIVVGQDRYGQVVADELVRFIETSQPISAAAARNRGARAAQSELLFFIDADCVAEPDLIERHVAHHSFQRRAVGGSYAPATRSFWTLSDHLASYSEFMPQASPGARPYLLSGNMSLNRQLFHELGGFDERFAGAAGEDVELSLRLESARIALFFEPGAVVHHHSTRVTFHGALQHLSRYGAVAADTRLHHAAQLPFSPGYELAARAPWLLLLLAPLAGLLKLLPIVAARPFLWRYWYAFPGMAAQQGAWCWGFGTVLCRQAAVEGRRQKAEGGRQKAESAPPTTDHRLLTTTSHSSLPLVYIIILHWKKLEETRHCLETLRSVEYPRDRVKVLVVDNYSLNGSFEALQREFGEVEYLALDANYGFAGGNNPGISAALARGADYVLLLNNDTLVPPDMLRTLVDAVETDPTLGVVSPKVVWEQRPDTLAGLGFRCKPYGFDLVGWNERDVAPRDDSPVRLDVVFGCAMLIRRQVLLDVGLLDERFFFYYEDVDFCVRAGKWGYGVAYIPTATVVHAVSTSTRGQGGQRERYLARSRQLFFRKHLRRHEWPAYLAHESVDMLRMLANYLIHGMPKAAWGYVQGTFAGLRMPLPPPPPLIRERVHESAF